MAEVTVRDLTRLIAARISVPVFYGEEHLKAGDVVTANRIELRELGPETTEVAQVTRSDDPTVFYQTVSVRFVIEGASSSGGAQEHEHKDVVRRIFGAFAVALKAECDAASVGIENGRITGAFDDSRGVDVGARYVGAFRLQFGINESAIALVDGSQLVLAGTTGVSIGGASQPVCSPPEVP